MICDYCHQDVQSGKLDPFLDTFGCDGCLASKQELTTPSPPNQPADPSGLLALVRATILYSNDPTNSAKQFGVRAAVEALDPIIKVAAESGGK